MVDVKPGQVYVPGSTSRTARALLDSAKAEGLNPKLAVKTTEGGFLVPQAVAERFTKPARTPEPPTSQSAPEPSPAPRRRRKKNPQKGS